MKKDSRLSFVAEPGDKLRSLYDLKPAIICPICDRKAKVRIYPRIHNQEGAELTTTHLNLYQYSSAGPRALKCYEIDIHTGDIEVSTKIDDIVIKLVAKHELPITLELVLQYCENKVAEGGGRSSYPGWSTYSHYYETLLLELDLQYSTVMDAYLTKFGLVNHINNQYISIEVDATSADIRRDLRSGNDLKDSESVRFQPVSVTKAAELIKTTKYMNLL